METKVQNMKNFQQNYSSFYLIHVYSAGIGTELVLIPNYRPKRSSELDTNQNTGSNLMFSEQFCQFFHTIDSLR